MATPPPPHADPVYDVFWIQSKTNNQFASVSTDGRMLWWDTRKLSEPTDEVSLTDANSRVLGGTSMEYNIEAGPAKYLVGTEQGVVLSMNMKKKGGGKGGDAGLVTAMDGGPGKHHGPIYSIQRNPFHPTNYMTVGDWSVRMWNEKNKTPIMQTPYSRTYLTGGCWSPTRAGLFFVTRQDGVVDAWDYYYRQSAPTYSHKVSDVPLSCISVQGSAQSGGGRLLAVGDAAGTVSLLELSDNLAVSQQNEKVSQHEASDSHVHAHNTPSSFRSPPFCHFTPVRLRVIRRHMQLLIGAMFDRESKREENLEKRAIALARAAKAAKADSAPAAPADGEEKDSEMEETLRTVDSQFLNLMKTAEEGGDASTASAPGSAPAAAQAEAAAGAE